MGHRPRAQRPAHARSDRGAESVCLGPVPERALQGQREPRLVVPDVWREARVTHVYVLDAWDELTQRATCRVFSSREDATRAMERYLVGHSLRVAGVVKRKVK